MGACGYCAPDYAMTGRKAIDESKNGGEHNLVVWVRPLFKEVS
jgi:hypothetical protein